MKAEGENEIFDEEQIFKQSAENLTGDILAKKNYYSTCVLFNFSS